MPFNEEIVKISQRRKDLGIVKYYDWDILNDCYEPLFSAGILDKLVFLPDYESSTGAKWEYNMALKNNIEIIQWKDVV